MKNIGILELGVIVGLAALWFLQIRMLIEVNHSLQPAHRWRYLRFWWPWDWIEVQLQHRKLLPQSRLRLAFNSIAAVWLPFAIVVALRLRDAAVGWTHGR